MSRMFNFERRKKERKKEKPRKREIQMKRIPLKSYQFMNNVFLIHLLLLFISPLLLFGQAKKPEVLIYGDGIDAYAAAVQSAKSRLHTIWVTESADLRSAMDLPGGNIESHVNLDGGIWADLLAGALGSDQRSDSISARAKHPFNPQLILNKMESQIDKYPHLHIYFGPGLRSVEKKRRNWQVRLSNGKRYTLRSIVDATADGRISQLSGIHLSFKDMESPMQRTGVVVTDLGGKTQTLALAQVIPTEEHNLFFTKHNPYIAPLLQKNIADLPLLAHTGQAVGAAAAYVAFYKTTSDRIEVRQVQAELLQYAARIMPYQDIPIEDPHFAAIQRIGALLIFEPEFDPNRNYLFSGEKTVSTAEIEPVLNALFSRSQIWFRDHQSAAMNLGELLSLIKYIAHRGDELDAQVEQLWSRRWGFEENDDLTFKISRRHFAVLMDEFVKPFDVRVDLQGQITR